MKIAVEGCAHGELDKIYETIKHIETQKNVKVDLLIICGDFQSVRNMADLKCMAVPQKFRKLNTFYKYYSGEKKAPVLTIFVGGNHEASNYLTELPYGGWVCENIYYMGFASVIQVNGLRIAGLSGIYKGHDYFKGHFEIIPYDDRTIRSVYHIRNQDVFKLKQIKKPLDIIISHDWPRGIQDYGDKSKLLKIKPFFKDDMESGKLGSRPAEELLFQLKPKYWFAAHLHCEFAALVPHSDGDDCVKTKFLALDKCLPKRKFLKIIDIESDASQSIEIKYDPEWLCILRSTNHLLNVSNTTSYMPGKGCADRWDFSVLEEELSEINTLFNNDFTIPLNFKHTANVYDSNNTPNYKIPEHYVNPQTTSFCQKLGIDDPNYILKSGIKRPETKKFSFVEDLNVTAISETSFDPDQSCSVQERDDDEDEDYSHLFFIDKKRSFNESFSSPPLTSSPVVDKKPDIDFNFPEYNEQNSTSISDPINISPSPSPFKIKRRNQSLYANKDDDE